MYSIIVLRRAQSSIERLHGSMDGVETEATIGYLAVDPNPQEASSPEGEPQSKFINVGENRKWMIVYEIDEEGLVVYVHSIERRPSANLDPR